MFFSIVLFSSKIPSFVRPVGLILLVVFLSGCFQNNKTLEDMKPYEGPLMEVEKMETVYSDSAEVKVKIKADRQVELQDGNREFPEGVLVEFFEHDKITSTLTANFGRYYRETNRYMVSGDVVIKNLEEGKRLNTEELFWHPAEEKIHVEKDKQVIITTKTEVLYGKGLEASQDFSKYKILQPTGEFDAP